MNIHLFYTLLPVAGEDSCLADYNTQLHNEIQC